jgi:uncharacterized protein YecT (DUF1311 family)
MLKCIVAISVVIVVGFITPTYADDSLIREIAKREKVSVDDVKKSLDEGCGSGITPLMNECANYHYIGADIQLNRTYQELLKKLKNSDSKILLVNMQKAWIVFRDATCEFETASLGGGTGRPAAYTSCSQSETEARTRILDGYLKCEDGCLWDD